jgi:hypothetical protein
MPVDFGGLNAASLSGFGDAASITYTPSGGIAFLLNVVDVDPNTLEGLQIPQAVVKWALASAFSAFPKAGDSVTISATVYSVHQVLREGENGGGLYLVLSKS